MNELTQLHPVEVRMLLSPEYVPLRELLRLAFLDLVRRKAIRIEQEQATGIYYVQEGPALQTLRPFAFEEPLTKIFCTSPGLRIQMKTYVKAIRSNIRFSVDRFKNLILKNPEAKQYYKRNVFYRALDIFLLTGEGLKLQHRLRGELKSLELQLGRLQRAKNEEGIAQLLKPLGGNAFLLANFACANYALTMSAELDLQFNSMAMANQQVGCNSLSSCWDAAFHSGGGCGGGDGGSGCGGGGSGCGGSGCGGGGCGGGCGGCGG